MLNILLLGFKKEFIEKIENDICCIVKNKSDNDLKYDIVAVNENKRLSKNEIHTNILLCPYFNKISDVKYEMQINCGINSDSDLTFSSINEENAVFFVSKPLKNVNGKTIELQEFKIKVEKGFTIYENIVFAGVKLLTH